MLILTIRPVQWNLDLRKILGVNKIFLKSRFFLKSGFLKSRFHCTAISFLNDIKICILQVLSLHYFQMKGRDIQIHVCETTINSCFLFEQAYLLQISIAQQTTDLYHRINARISTQFQNHWINTEHSQPRWRRSLRRAQRRFQSRV